MAGGSRFARDMNRMNRIVGIVLTIAGIGFLALGGYLLTLSVISWLALSCCGACGVGLLGTGVMKLLGRSDDD